MKALWWLLLLSYFAWCQSEEQLKLETPTTEKTLAAGKSASYFIAIPTDIQANTQFLIFDVYPTGDDASDPDVYISDVFHFLVLLV